jgi:hypothetical protein
MTSMKPDMSPENILRELSEQAKSLWGEQRAEALQAQLEQTARNLQEIAQNLPRYSEVEPGFYH